MPTTSSTSFESVTELGKLQAELRPRAACLLPLFTLAFMGLGTCMAIAALRTPQAPSIQRYSGMLGLAIGGCVVVALVLTVWTFQALTQAVGVYERGFAVRTRASKRLVAWHQIAAVWQRVIDHYQNGTYVGTSYQYKVLTDDGFKFKFDEGLEYARAMGELIQARVTAALLPCFQQQLRTGERVAFGKLTLDNNFLYYGNKAIRWQDIIRVRIERGIITIHTDKVLAGRIKIKVAEVPNFWIFHELINVFALVEYGMENFRR